MIGTVLSWLAGFCVGAFVGFVAGNRDTRQRDDLSLASALHRAKRIRTFMRFTLGDHEPDVLNDADEMIDLLETTERRRRAKAGE
jgi:hypothetical protein